MPAPRQQPASSPRFPRGLEWLFWGGLAGLLGFGIIHWRAKNHEDSVPPVFPVAESFRPVAGKPFNRPVPREKSQREMRLEKFLAALAAETDAERREELLGQFAADIPMTDFEVTLGDLRQIGPEEIAADLAQRLLRRWTANDARAAAAWAVALPSGPKREQALTDVAVEWSNASLADASGWAKTLGDESGRNVAMAAVAGEAVRTEPVEALRLAVELPDTPQRDDLIHRAAVEWAAQDPAEAIAWAGQIPDETLRAKVLAGEAVSWAEQDPQAAATLVVEKLPAGRVQDDAVISIIQRWAQQKPEDAAAWVEQFPEGPLRTAAVENLLAQISPAGADGAGGF